ncbi:glutamine synthetase [Devosia epidermidihirudinis]|uniref:Glutamine synthetase n=1 Tax=Devosia epidermidihirudinis TaxID=1293439 RepID=A0A0F5QBY9_9HYPH|nr:glutamine synthetase family protein [Devosia epidermidihirudinis]KKC38238.1 glutamine synthetase [Devosia epidermidihirudinis]
MAYTLAELTKDVAAGSIDTVLVAFPDMQGRMIGKRFQAEYFLEMAEDETHGCDYLLADDIDMEPVPGYEAANWGKGYGDFVMRPDLATLMKASWLEGTAIVLCDLSDHHHHEPIPHSPRAILKAQLDRLAAMGYTANAATELEFYLFDEDYRTVAQKGYRAAQTAGDYIQDYNIFQTTKEEGVMRALRKHLQASGIPVESSKGEWGPGQEEINVKYADALTMADRHVVLKNATKEIAYAQGKSVTFMAKWDYALAGSSSHIHMSLADISGKSLFADSSDERGMSTLMKQFMAGQLAYARDITYFLAPYINSYKRFQAGTFAPTKAIWSSDNRTAGFRLCGEHSKSIRIECRMGGADLNPYLALAALIAAGIKGIEDKLELEPVFVGDAYITKELREIPKTLREATDTLRNSAMLKSAFGDHVVAHYVHTAEWEQLEYDRRVTDWELQRGFERS